MLSSVVDIEGLHFYSHFNDKSLDAVKFQDGDKKLSEVKLGIIDPKSLRSNDIS